MMKVIRATKLEKKVETEKMDTEDKLEDDFVTLMINSLIRQTN